MRCKIGDLAILINPTVEENLGALVEVMSVAKTNPRVWSVRSLSGPRMRSDGTVAEKADAPDKTLEPIRGANKREQVSIKRGRRPEESAPAVVGP